MTQAKGSAGQLLMDFETTYNTDPGTPAGMKLPVNTVGLQGSRNLNAAATITGNRNPVAPFQGNTSSGGSIVIPMDSTAFGYWCKAMFGTPTTTGTGPYEHVFKIADEQPSLVLEQGFTDIDQYLKYNGCKVNQFSMTTGGDGELTGSVDIVGASFALSDTSYDASPTAVSINRLNNFQASLEEGGSSVSDATEVAISLGFNLDTSNYVIGADGVLGSLPEGLMSISGSLTTLFEDETYLNKAINTTESSLKLTLTNGSSSIVEFYLPELNYEVSSPPIDGPNGIRCALNFQGFYDDNSDATSCKVTVTNSTDSYA